MANEEHFAILKEGVQAWNQWCKKTKKIANLKEGDFCNANLAGVNLSRGSLQNVNLEGANLRSADLGLTNLTGANLKGANLEHANLSGAILGHVSLAGANLQGANLRDVILNDANLGGANLCDANLSHVNLNRANLAGARFSRANLERAYFKNANLSGAILCDANLNYSHLCDANLRDANLWGASFRTVDLTRTDFRNARFFGTKFADCNLRTAKGLELAHHIGPSSIDIDTLYKSGGIIPESFLRGCGVPETLIPFIPSFAGPKRGVQFYSCFISYNANDKQFADQLYERMQQEHLRVWYAPQDMRGGEKTHEQIETAIRSYDKLLIVLSKASLQSEWVMKELRKAFETQRQSGKRKLFPVRLTDFRTLEKWECHDSKSGKDLAEELRQYFIPDFSNWKDHDQFEAAFARLLKDLRTEERAK